jgi:hypothetical protein
MAKALGGNGSRSTIAKPMLAPTSDLTYVEVVYSLEPPSDGQEHAGLALSLARERERWRTTTMED